MNASLGPARARKERRRHLKFTREGRVFVFVTFGLGFAALNTGNNLMYLAMAFMLSLIVLSGVLSELAIKDLVVTRRLPERAFAGEPMLVELSVHNGKRRLPSFSIELADHAENADEPRRCYLLKIEPKASRSVTYRRTPPRRGELVLTHYRIGTRYPFSLFDKWRSQEDRDALLVYPHREPWEVPKASGYCEGEQGGKAAGRGTETRELREYRHHDEVRRIHWRRSAAMGLIVVREFEDESTRLVSLVVDNAVDTADPGARARLELAISRAAYAAEHLLLRGASVEVVARGESSPLLGPGDRVDPVWRFLARLSAMDDRSATMLHHSRPRAQRIVVDGDGTPG